ncbi:MAG: MFS transporter [Proteobacteria bacterium]|jgi:sugar phosphate permease|nr:MFS transporter [Pseudomonadota bacterium]MBT5065408.1 MFS transporter [Pseudomonadota bacterium]MBT6193332.1 MFS transporter [Pseudomonadota bacterium]MBT6464765.1 MFS transporter [Pseudomonadota bacterium]MBT7246706.1 MFS transporter [Pseudomonadota bacterium]
MNVPKRLLAMVALVAAGEMIFSLPFHLPRYLRPSVLEGFNLTNSELGDIFAVYGVTAMLAYFPGGLIADKFNPKILIIISLVATAIGGIYLATFPGVVGLAILYAYWGITTIFLFWAGLMKSTREWGGDAAQGRAFGFLEGGRGLAAAVFASIAVWLFAQGIPTLEIINQADRRQALSSVIFLYTGLTFLAAISVAIWLPNNEKSGTYKPLKTSVLKMLVRLDIWLIAIVITCAYCGYKGLDNYALYAHQVLGMSEVESASFISKTAYLRIFAAISAGLLADRIQANKTLIFLFLTLFLSYSFLGIWGGPEELLYFIIINIIITLLAVFALRGVYFAMLEETKIPARNTGSAVGLVSIVGYTPDIFLAPIGGRILDASPGAEGHLNYFWLLSAISLIGVIAAVALYFCNNHLTRDKE